MVPSGSQANTLECVVEHRSHFYDNISKKSELQTNKQRLISPCIFCEVLRRNLIKNSFFYSFFQSQFLFVVYLCHTFEASCYQAKNLVEASYSLSQNELVMRIRLIL